MYPVSEAFLKAIQSKTRRYYWTGIITTTAGQVYEFGPRDIVKGSGYISAQCCGSSEIELGTVYAAEFGISLFLQIDRYTLKDAEVALTYHLYLADGAVEAVPMGIFTVSEANRTAKCLELKGYDRMLSFEKAFRGLETVGTPYDFLALCCKKCKVELAQTKEEIEAMPNGKEIISIYPENDIETYRDCLYFVGQVLAGFFVINREGKLEVRHYGMEPVQTYGAKQRFTSSFSDFITRYTAIYSTNWKTEIAEYYPLDPDDGLTMNLGINPLLQFGLDETREKLCQNILAEIAKISYVPFDSDTIGNPALDLGDVIAFSGGHADDGKVAAITSIECRIGGRETFKCVGKNPLLAAGKSKSDKNIAGLMNQIEKDKIGIHTFTNASEIELGSEDHRIISIQFAAAEDNPVQFFGQVGIDVAAEPVTRTAVGKTEVTIPGSSGGAEKTDSGTGGTETDKETTGTGEAAEKAITVPVEVPVTWTEDGKAVVTVTYEFNDSVIEALHPVETWGSGKHLLNLYYPITKIVLNFTNTFNVYVRIKGGTGKIEIGSIVASVSGQSMAAKEAWDGKISLSDSFVPVGLASPVRPARYGVYISNETMWEKKQRVDVQVARQKVRGMQAFIETGGSR